ncbi:hypothetical protein AZ66_19390 [Paenibacillus sp. E194]|uniref:CgeB family protein n=1 Tax=Paenibacillus sp. E194 TaxID=1458845 RepID=UPI0005CA2AC2|nr:DUF3880 domain-containing protein [Paenibacillus sp. E194]KJB86329.1 hypothetical protein AZ66_19390 [Paenibacillus sp. E194]
MRLYYIASGYRRPIDILDNALMKALYGQCHESKIFLLNRAPLQQLLPDICEFRPEFVLTICGPRSFLPVDQVRSIRRMGIPIGVWFVDDPYAIDNALQVAAEYDIIFTIDSGCVPYYERHGCKRVHHLPLGTDTDIFRPFNAHPSYESDICFIGTGYDNRLRMMQQMLKELDSGLHVKLVGHFWDTVNWSGGCIPHLRTKWVNFSETPRYYNGAKLVLNIHRSEDDTLIDKNKTGAPGHTINNRTFDIAACRRAQIIDYRPDLHMFYEPGAELLCFESPKECAELIHTYLYEDAKRSSIASQGYERTRAEHTFAKRLEHLLSRVRELE